jgi:polysaccharide deacetylase family protein (PEP-CTERM system associated)
VKHDHYGWPEAPRFGFRPVNGSDFIELPVTTARFIGRTLAAGGGGFFRMLPYGFSQWAVRQVNSESRPAIIYFHPWEIDPGQPRVTGASLKSKLRHYTNLSGMEGKLERLISDFKWGRVDAVAAEQKKVTA